MMHGAALRTSERVSFDIDAELASRQRSCVHLARFLLRPADYIHADHRRGLGLPPAVVDRMNGDARFRRAVNAALGDLLLADFAFDPSAAAGLDGSREGRLGILMLVAPIDAVHRLATFFAAAVVSRRVTCLLRQSELRSARAALGEAGFVFAISEAPLMFADLAGLDPDPTAPLPVSFEAYAVSALDGLMTHIAPQVAGLFRLRFGIVSPISPGSRFSGVHISQAMRLIHRKEPSWSASIG